MLRRIGATRFVVAPGREAVAVFVGDPGQRVRKCDVLVVIGPDRVVGIRDRGEPTRGVVAVDVHAIARRHEAAEAARRVVREGQGVAERVSDGGKPAVRRVRQSVGPPGAQRDRQQPARGIVGLDVAVRGGEPPPGRRAGGIGQALQERGRATLVVLQLATGGSERLQRAVGALRVSEDDPCCWRHENAPVPRRAPYVARLLGRRVEAKIPGAVVEALDLEAPGRARPVVHLALRLAAVEKRDRIADAGALRAFGWQLPAFEVAVRSGARAVGPGARDPAPLSRRRRPRSTADCSRWKSS